MSNPIGRSAISVLFAGLLLFPGVARANGNDADHDHDHHGDHGDSFWIHGAGWAVVGAVVVVGGILLFRYVRGDKSTQVSSKTPSHAKAEVPSSMAIAPIGDIGMVGGVDDESEQPDAQRKPLGLTLAVRF